MFTRSKNHLNYSVEHDGHGPDTDPVQSMRQRRSRTARNTVLG